jgi:hypothetical protein
MKLASYHRSRGNEIRYVRGESKTEGFKPDQIEVTSLFTYAWQPVHRAIRFYHRRFPRAKVRAGGIYATLMPDHLKSAFPDLDVHKGLYDEIERYMPDYEILEEVENWKGWDTSILFTSRGCIRNCPFCVVPKIEGRLRSNASDVKYQILPGHKKVTIWDNNFLASPDWKRVIDLLVQLGLRVDFNQGLDARLIDEEKAKILADLKMPFLRMAFDSVREKKAITNSVDLLADAGFKRRSLMFYVLYNFHSNRRGMKDTPSTFLERIRYVLDDLGCTCYPMRYEPPNSLEKNRFVSPEWTPDQLELVAKARRVIGYGGAFPPYNGLVNKFRDASNFEEAFGLYPRKTVAS